MLALIEAELRSPRSDLIAASHVGSDDVETAQVELREAGVEVGEVQDSPVGRFVFFTDPDGNGWAVQQFAACD